MRSRIAVAVMAALLVLYIALVGQRAWLLIVSGDPIGVVMGAVLVVFPVVAAWALGRELWFGIRAKQLGRRLGEEGGLPAELVAVRPSGRVLREEGESLFPAYKDQAEQHPDDWRSWYRLGLVYDAAGDRRRARAAVRTAITLEKSDRPVV